MLIIGIGSNFNPSKRPRIQANEGDRQSNFFRTCCIWYGCGKCLRLGIGKKLLEEEENSTCVALRLTNMLR